MNIPINIVDRKPKFWHADRFTRKLFLVAEEMTLDLGLPIDELYLGTKRNHPVPHLRHCLMYVLKEDYHWTLAEIGRAFGCSHCKPFYAYKTIKNLIDIKDPLAVRYVTKLQTYGEYTEETEAQCIPCTCAASQGPQVQ